MVRNLETYKKHSGEFTPLDWRRTFYYLEQNCYWPSEDKIKHYRKMLTESKEEFHSILANANTLLELFEIYTFLRFEDCDISAFENNVVTLFWYLDDTFNFKETNFSDEYISCIIKLYELNHDCFYVLLERFQSNAQLIQSLLIKAPVMCKIDIVSQLDLSTHVFVMPSEERFQLDDEIIQTVEYNLIENFNSFSRDYGDHFYDPALFHSPYLDLLIQCIVSKYQNSIGSFDEKVDELVQEFNTMHYSWFAKKETRRKKYYSLILAIKVYTAARKQLLHIEKTNDSLIASFDSIVDKQILYLTDLERVNETIGSIFGI